MKSVSAHTRRETIFICKSSSTKSIREQVSCFKVLSCWKYLACSQIILIYSIFLILKSTKPKYNFSVLHYFYISVPSFIRLNIQKYRLFPIYVANLSSPFLIVLPSLFWLPFAFYLWHLKSFCHMFFPLNH